MTTTGTTTGTTTPVKVRYDDALVSGDGSELVLRTDGVRGGVQLNAVLTRPAQVRDALTTLSSIVASDLRRKARSRADYLAYLLAQGKRASQEVWNAQKAFLADSFRTEQTAEAPLDPLVHLDATGLSFEVFSADESAYARLHLPAATALETSAQSFGTSHIRFETEALTQQVQRLRSHRGTQLRIEASGEAGKVSSFAVPHRWLRAFGQVQAASTLPATRFELDPVDLYNVLLSLRLKRARTSPRALRYELVPGEPPRLILEPWERSITSCGGVYRGAVPTVVRTWGRRRLLSLAPLLPHAKRVTVHLMGPGLPAFYVVDLGEATFTLALCGWTDSGWAGVSTFDLLTAREQGAPLAADVRELLKERPQGPKALATALSVDLEQVHQAVLHEIQAGTVLHDLANAQLVYRPLLATPIEAAAVRYRDPREREAHRLLAVAGAVEVTRVHDLGDEGTKIEGEVNDASAHRSYRASFTIDREGRTVDADCTSPQFRRSGLREGPSVPMLALRMLYSRQRAELERARNTPEGRRLIVVETRVMTRRVRDRTLVYRVSLDDRQVAVRWGPSHGDMRLQRLFFTDAQQARTAYFAQLERLGSKGYIDASAAEALS